MDKAPERIWLHSRRVIEGVGALVCLDRRLPETGVEYIRADLVEVGQCKDCAWFELNRDTAMGPMNVCHNPMGKVYKPESDFGCRGFKGRSANE